MKPDEDDAPNFEPLSETPLAHPVRLMTLDDIRAMLDPDVLAAISGITAKYAHLAPRDDKIGVQVRMAPAVEAFQLCLIHEIRRAKARGTGPTEVIEGTLTALGMMMINLVSNHFDTPEHQKSAYARLACALLRQCLSTLGGLPETMESVEIDMGRGLS
jgi:hypothetical protein